MSGDKLDLTKATPEQLRAEIRRLRDCILSARWKLAKGRGLWTGFDHECDGALHKALVGEQPYIDNLYLQNAALIATLTEVLEGLQACIDFSPTGKWKTANDKATAALKLAKESGNG